MNIEIISGRITFLEKAKKEAHIERVMREEELRNSQRYIDLTEQIKALKAEREALVHKNAIAAKIAQHIKDLNEEIKTTHELLDYELLNFNRETDNDQIETDRGMYKFKFRSTIKKTNQRQLL